MVIASAGPEADSRGVEDAESAEMLREPARATTSASQARFPLRKRPPLGALRSAGEVAIGVVVERAKPAERIRSVSEREEPTTTTTAYRRARPQ